MRGTAALVFAAALGAAFPAPPAAPAAPPAQCRRADTPVRKQLRFARGRTTGVVRDTVRLCTRHEYVLRARAGQTMSVNLVAGDKTSFTLYAPTRGLEGADGVKGWAGELPEDGDYQISIGTDATASYTLEVTIR